MAQEQRRSFPRYYGQAMPDSTVAENPRLPPDPTESRDALLRLPIQLDGGQMNNQDRQLTSPVVKMPTSSSAIARGSTSIDSNRTRRARLTGGSGHWIAPQNNDREHEDYFSRVGSAPNRSAYVEDYSDEDHRPLAYQRPARRHTRPPLAHARLSMLPGPTGRYSFEREPRGSVDGARSSYDYGYESDAPTKVRFSDSYGFASEGEDDGGHRALNTYPGIGRRQGEVDGGYRQPQASAGGGGQRGPPRKPPSTEEVMRLPWTMWMNSNAKNHFVAFVGEFVGTTMFLFFAFSGTQVANVQSNSSANTTTGAATGFSPPVLQYISLVFGFSLMVNVWIFFRISGGLFNPAVTFAMLLTKALTPVRFFLLLVAQLVGSIFSSFLVSVMFPPPLNVRTTLSPDTSLVQGVFIEAVLTAELVFTIFMLAKEKHKATFIAPVGIGLAMFVAELVGVYYTGGSLNPARSFGPCVVTNIFDQEHWIYWVGPAVGAVLAVVFYNFIKILEYEMANPDQDDNEKDVKRKQIMDEERQ